MSSFDDITLSDLQGLAKNLSVASYGTKADIIGRLTQHAAGVSMLKTLDQKAKLAKTLKQEEKGKKKGTTKGSFIHKEKLSPKFCKEFGVKLMGVSTKDGVTSYTYAEKGKEEPKAKGAKGKRKSEDGDGPAKKKKKAKKEEEEGAEEEEEEEEEKEEDKEEKEEDEDKEDADKDEDEDEDDEDEDDEEEDAEFDFNFFKAKLKNTLGDDRDLANKLLRKYEPTLPIKKIKNLTDAKMFKALADIMCYDEE